MGGRVVRPPSIGADGPTPLGGAHERYRVCECVSLRVAGSLVRARRSVADGLRSRVVFAQSHRRRATAPEKRTAPPAWKRRRGGSDRKPGRLPTGSRPNLGLSAHHRRTSGVPALREGDHRAGERALSAPEPGPGSGESCDGNPSPARARRSDARTKRVRDGRHRRATRPRAHGQRRRPQDARAASAAECTWANDWLDHGVAPD
jgi:hypothetical protein